MIEIKRYNCSDKKNWNDFLAKSRIDTFLFNRDFMDYHSDRFKDFSYMIYKKGKLEALLPGNIDNQTFYTHQGLTYGGIVSSTKFHLMDYISSFDLINEDLRHNGVKEVIYKPTPFIYHKIPNQEELYVLFKLNAKKIGCNISSTIFQKNKISFNESRKSGIRKAKKNNITIQENTEFETFWSILIDNLLTTHETYPTHNIDEIRLLKSRFPDNIKLYLTKIEEIVIGGCVLFIMENIIHVQYISASEQGKALGALDLLFDELINCTFSHIPLFDFGQSTENSGLLLNNNLIFQKEGFGGRGVVYDIYKYEIDPL
jgi:hypothetical protein